MSRYRSIFVALVLLGSVSTLAPHELRAQGPDIVAQVIGQAVRNPAEYSDVRTAVNRFRNRDFAGAKKLFEEAKQRSAELPPAATMMARLYQLANETENVRSALESAILADPKDPEAYTMMGDLLQRDRYLVPAEILYSQALELATNYPGTEFRKGFLVGSARLGLASIAERREDWPAAVKQLQSIAQADTRNAGAIARLSRAIYLSQPDQKEAEETAFKLLEEVSKRVETPTPPEVQMASFCHQVGKEEGAKAWFEKVLARAPNDVNTRMAVTRWALDVFDLEMARQNIDKALELAPQSFDALMLSGLTARFEKKVALAETTFERCHLMRPDEFQPTNQLALALTDELALDKQDKAMAYAKVNARANSDLTTRNGRDAAVTLGWVLFLTDHGTEAQSTVQQAVARGPLSPEASYFAARVLYDTGQTEMAKELLDSIASQPGSFPTSKEMQQLRSRL